MHLPDHDASHGFPFWVPRRVPLTDPLIIVHGLHPGIFQKAKAAADKGTAAWNKIAPVLQQYLDDSDGNKYSRGTDNKPHVAQLC